MGKAEIESWISSSASSDPAVDSSGPGSSSGSSEWCREYVLTDWSRAQQIASTRLLSSSTKARIQFLVNELLVFAKHGGESKYAHPS